MRLCERPVDSMALRFVPALIPGEQIEAIKSHCYFSNEYQSLHFYHCQRDVTFK
jgi:hypothetical protein